MGVHKEGNSKEFPFQELLQEAVSSIWKRIPSEKLVKKKGLYLKKNRVKILQEVREDGEEFTYKEEVAWEVKGVTKRKKCL